MSGDVALAAPKCTVSTAADVLFGPYDVFATTPLDAIGRLRLQCPKGLQVQVTITGGNSGTCTTHGMSGPGDSLCYGIFLDQYFTVPWGDGTNGTSVFTSNAGNLQVQMFGRVPPGQNVGAGTYNDTLTVTVFL